MSLKKISIIGPPGSGKTTFCKILRQNFDFKLYSLDEIRISTFLNTGKVLNDEEFNEMLQNIYKEDAWILDGFYFETIPDRVRHSDIIVLFDPSIFYCFKNILIRSLKNFFGKSDTSNAIFSSSLRFKIKYLMNMNFYKKVMMFKEQKPKILMELQNKRNDLPIVVPIYSPKQIAPALENIKNVIIQYN